MIEEKVPAIRIRGLVKDYRIGMRGYKLRAVDELSLAIRQNEVFGLLGPNGCGKSTTMKLLLGLLKPTRGDYEIFGDGSASSHIRSRIGYLPEAPYFYRYLTGRELVKFYARMCGLYGIELNEQVDWALKVVKMEKASRRRVGDYSKGMLQRIGIAQAIVHNPDLVILDEPTSGLDPIAASAIGEMILDLKQHGKTVLLCSHLLTQVEHVCDRIGLMDAGQLILEGALSELLTVENRHHLEIENCSPALKDELAQLIRSRGASLVGSDPSKMHLEQLFREHIKLERL